MTSGDHINQRAVAELQESARDMRERFIRDAYETVRVAFEHQDAEFDQQAITDEPPAVMTYFVTEDVSHLPFENLEAQHSLSIYLTGQDTEISGVGRSMQVYVPCPSEVTVDAYSDISAFELPSFVVVKHVDKDGEVAWFQVSRDAVTPHFPEVETEECALEDLIASTHVGELIQRAFSRRVDANVGVIALLREELVNMDIAPQRIVTDEGIFDLTQAA